MSAYDLIIVGLGPAGCILGNRAQARGLRVLGIDRSEKWTATYGGWVDELIDVPFYWQGQPRVRFGGLGHVLDREYGIVDADLWRAQLVTFDTVKAVGQILAANHVQAGGQDYWADVVVDGRGLELSTGPVQQALGWFLDDGPTAWMDFAGPSFLYGFPTARGHLVEETVLATVEEVEWAQLEDKLQQRFPAAQPTAVERVLIPLGQQEHTGPALPYGARAGFINPISGYSLGTSLRFAEQTLDALWHGGKLPWRTRAFRTDKALCAWLLKVMLRVTANDQQRMLLAILRSPFHKRFLTLGDPIGTFIGMLWVFAKVPLSTKIAIIKACSLRV